MRFIGVDLAWSEKNPSGVAVLDWREDAAVLVWAGVVMRNVDILECIGPVGECVVAVDAPLVISNPPGTSRGADVALGRVFRKYQAGALPTDVTSAPRAGELFQALCSLGFSYTRLADKTVIEVYPHAAQVALFKLERTLKYKRGRVGERREGLACLQRLMRRCLTSLRPVLKPSRLFEEFTTRDPEDLKGEGLKELEDVLDAIICAYTACYYWYWGEKKCFIFRDEAGGCIVSPRVV